MSLADAKAWLRVDDTDEDILISHLIDAARSYVETFTRRALITRQLELSFDAFPGSGRVACGRISEARGGASLPRSLILPRPPLISVQSVKYYDTAGTLQTFSSAGYHVDTRAEPGRVVLHEDYDWPDTQSRPNAVIVAYTAGYGDAARDVPQGIRTAIRFLVTHWHANRTPVSAGAMNVIPSSAEALLWQFRIPEAF